MTAEHAVAHYYGAWRTRRGDMSEVPLAADFRFLGPVADAGYWHQRQIQQLASDGFQVLVPPDAGLRKGARPGWTGGMYSFMRRVLATPHGQELYRQRQVTIEPVFRQIKFNRALKRFQRRGRTACRSGWRLIAATHNLLKLHHHRLAAGTA